MEFISLEQAIIEAGSPIQLLWKPNAAPWSPPLLAAEYDGWEKEQTAWRTTVALFDMSYHMTVTSLSGPDATRLLSDLSANNYKNFAVGQAKQFVPVAADGNIVGDAILLRTAEDAYTMTGIAAAQNWVAYHASKGGYDVELSLKPSMSFAWRKPSLTRIQVQGPRALELVEQAFGAPFPETKFFHATDVTLAGAPLRALRHGIAGQPGYEFIGDYADHDAVMAALRAAGEPLGVVMAGARAYATLPVESGWFATPVAAIYTDPSLADYRQTLSVHSYEGSQALHGSYYSEHIEDYYTSPWELGYGRSISLNHDFVGRDALIAARSTVRRKKVTLEFAPKDALKAGLDPNIYQNSYGRYRIEQNGALVGWTVQTTNIAPLDSVLALALVDTESAVPGTLVEVIWGENPGPTGAPEPNYHSIRAKVQPAPYDDYARTQYRAP